MLQFKTVLSRWQCQYLQVVGGKPHVFLNVDETIDFATAASHTDDMKEVTCQGNEDPFSSSADSLPTMEDVNRDANHQHALVKEVVVDSPFEISAPTIHIKIVMKGAESFTMTIPTYLFHNKDGEYCDDNTAQEIIFTELWECVPYMMLEFQDSYSDIIADIQEQLLFMFMFSGTQSALYLAAGPVCFHLLETNVERILAIFADCTHLTLDLSASLACDPPLSDEYIIARKENVDRLNVSSISHDDHRNDILIETHHGEFYDKMPLNDLLCNNDESNQYGDETVHGDNCGAVHVSNLQALLPDSKVIQKGSTKVMHKATIYCHLQLPNEVCDRLLLLAPLETIAEENENRAKMKPALSYDIADDPEYHGYTYLAQMLCKDDDKEQCTSSWCSPSIVLSTDPQAISPEQNSLLLLLSMLPYQLFLEMPIIYAPQQCFGASVLLQMPSLHVPAILRLLLVFRSHSLLLNPAWICSSSIELMAAATLYGPSDSDHVITISPRVAIEVLTNVTYPLANAVLGNVFLHTVNHGEFNGQDSKCNNNTQSATSLFGNYLSADWNDAIDPLSSGHIVSLPIHITHKVLEVLTRCIPNMTYHKTILQMFWNLGRNVREVVNSSNPGHDLLTDLTSPKCCPVPMSRQTNLKYFISMMSPRSDDGTCDFPTAYHVFKLMFYTEHMKLHQFPPSFREKLFQAPSLRSFTVSLLPQLQLLLPSHLLLPMQPNA